ncbi:hypothetical protein [Candidatus Palauibacter sp.]|uniref:hypothetical protein n=1 Tax=Candidatus Palauibacter sp. TaxID=3101350 RepID=UPI003B014F5A
MSESNGQLDAIIVAIQALDTKIENYSINLRDKIVSLREVLANHRDYVDRRFETQDAKLAHIAEVIESLQPRQIGFVSDEDDIQRRYNPKVDPE